MSFIVAIDGPSGTGKGTITELIAKKFNFQYLDTGATYRCVTLKMIKENIKMDETEKIKEMLKNIKIEFDGEKVFLDGEDVSKQIREADVTSMVSQVSHLQEVRTAMVELQRRMSEGKEVILDGRDIGTNVFPNADVKIYLDATPEERAKRRYLQNKENGIEIPFEEILENVKQRDYIDSTREIAPLKKAEDAIYIDSSNMSIDEVVNEIKQIIIKKRTE